MNVRRTKTALLWLLLLTSTATLAQSDGHFSDKDQESPTTEGNSGYSDDSQDNPATENGNSGHSDDEEENIDVEEHFGALHTTEGGAVPSTSLLH